MSNASSATACSANSPPLRMRGRRRRSLKSRREPEPLPKSASDSTSLAPSRKLDRDMQIAPETQVVIDFDDNRAASALVGPYGQNLALIERRLNVVVDSRGNHITIAGTRDGCTAAQDSYIRALKKHELVFGIGPAGTGKTWLAVAQAAQLFERKEVDRIILTRPAVEAGERLGFLPGDLREKVDPYLRPIYDALYDLMDSRVV